ncbi:MAG: shikimate kinase AroK [Candidatus Sedimenticola sp. 6PFRAG5]
MTRIKNIFLVGPMGAGKTTIGRQLAELLGLDFDDSDKEIQRRTGVDIPTIFDFEGEDGFRRREKSVIDELTQREGIVLATGGGAVLDVENRGWLSGRGVVVYLYCSPEQQFERTMRDRNRPLLQTDDPLSKLETLMEERDPIYRQIADVVVQSEKRSAASVAKEIMRKIQSD